MGNELETTTGEPTLQEQLIEALTLIVSYACDRLPDGLGGHGLPDNRDADGRVCTWLVDGSWISLAQTVLAKAGKPAHPTIYGKPKRSRKVA